MLKRDVEAGDGRARGGIITGTVRIAFVFHCSCLAFYLLLVLSILI